ncbi:MAG: ABC transporter substrate-binding protein [Planctomyces sp.]
MNVFPSNRDDSGLIQLHPGFLRLFHGGVTFFRNCFRPAVCCLAMLMSFAGCQRTEDSGSGRSSVVPGSNESGTATDSGSGISKGAADPTSPNTDGTPPNAPDLNSGESINVRLALNWYAEAEHGGYLAARTHGYFAEQGVNVEVIPGGPGAPQQIITELATERIEFAVSDADNVVKARSAGVPLVAVMAPLQNSPRCIMVHASSGIDSLDKLAGVELAISEARPFALWMKKKLPLKDVTMVPYSGSVGEFLTKQSFAQQGFVFSEPFVAREQGGDPQVLMVSDIGFNPYASVLVTTEKMIQEKGDVVRRVVKASLAGWNQYLADPLETNQDIHRDNNDMSLAVLAYGAEQMKPLCFADNQSATCDMTSERWKVLVSQIEEIGEIEPGSVAPESCFTREFLKSPPKNQSGSDQASGSP